MWPYLSRAAKRYDIPAGPDTFTPLEEVVDRIGRHLYPGTWSGEELLARPDLPAPPPKGYRPTEDDGIRPLTRIKTPVPNPTSPVPAADGDCIEAAPLRPGAERNGPSDAAAPGLDREEGPPAFRKRASLKPLTEEERLARQRALQRGIRHDVAARHLELRRAEQDAPVELETYAWEVLTVVGFVTFARHSDAREAWAANHSELALRWREEFDGRTRLEATIQTLAVALASGDLPGKVQNAALSNGRPMHFPPNEWTGARIREAFYDEPRGYVDLTGWSVAEGTMARPAGRILIAEHDFEDWVVKMGRRGRPEQYDYEPLPQLVRAILQQYKGKVPKQPVMIDLVIEGYGSNPRIPSRDMLRKKLPAVVKRVLQSFTE